MTAAAWCGLSDFLDGQLSRKLKATTSFGAQLDQYADKICCTVLLLELVLLHSIHIWFFCLFVFRELIVIVLRSKHILPKASDPSGKWKTFLIYTLILFCLSCSSFAPQLSIVPIVFMVEVAILSLSYSVFTKLLFRHKK